MEALCILNETTPCKNRDLRAISSVMGDSCSCVRNCGGGNVRGGNGLFKKRRALAPRLWRMDDNTYVSVKTEKLKEEEGCRLSVTGPLEGCQEREVELQKISSGTYPPEGFPSIGIWWMQRVSIADENTII